MDRGAATATIERDRIVAPVSRRLFGTFVEHMGRCVYGGLYDPEHPSADASGFRSDVTDLVRELGPTIVRYPGGNFVSGYDWEDGIGPVGERPVRLGLPWHSLEPNAVGLHEFVAWARHAGLEPMYAVNLGTRGVDAARAVVEYANHPSGTAWSDRRRANGADEPFGIRTWCLGNELDGPWQLGHTSARAYGRLAREAGKAMRLVDPSIELVVCGSSNRWLPTFGDWDREVLEETYDVTDLLSVHAYYERQGDDVASFLGTAAALDDLIESVLAVADGVRASGGHERRIDLALDEWNVWRTAGDGEDTRAAVRRRGTWDLNPRLLEGDYDVLDAVVVATMLHTLLRHADRVKIANHAQLVNVLAPIRTPTDGGAAWRQTVFWPFARIAELARGDVLDVAVDAPATSTRRYGDVPEVDVVATRDDERGVVALFVAHRGREADAEVSVDLRGLSPARVLRAEVLAGPAGGDPSSAASFSAASSSSGPGRELGMRALEYVGVDGDRIRLRVPPVSWSCLEIRLEETP